MLLTQNLITHSLDQDWSLSFFEEFSSLCLENGQITQELRGLFAQVLKGQNEWASFRMQIRLKSTPLLLAVFYDEKKIRLAGARMGNELFVLGLLESLEHREHLQNEGLESEHYQKVKEHLEAIAALDPRTFPSQHEWASRQYDLVHLLDDSSAGVNARIKDYQNELIDQLLKHLNQYRPVLFERVSDFGLGLTAQYALLRIHLLKFLAILPSLDHDKTGKAIKRILLESFRRLMSDSKKAYRLKKKGQERALPKRLIFLMGLVKTLATVIPANILAWMIRASVRLMARRFIAGESIEEAQKSFRQIFSTGRDVTLDQLGELVVSEQEADHYRDEVLKLICGFAQHIPKGERNSAGINRAHVSIKVSALCSHFKPEAPEVTYQAVAPRLREILMAAREYDVFLNIDAEHYHYRDIVLDIYARVLFETPELKDFQSTGIVLQAYLRDASWHLDQIIALARKRGLLMPIRLVKGAYWDAETVEAHAHSYNAPEFLNKEETDLNFRQMVYKIFENGEFVQLCLASHNFADHCFARALHHKMFSSAPTPEHQCLHMTYEALSTSLAQMGWATRNYVPIGSLLVGMAYLVRRIMENSSQVGVLTIMRSHKKAASLASCEELFVHKKAQKMLERDITQEKMTDKFFNVAPVRTYLRPEREWVEKSLAQWKQESLGKTYRNRFELTGQEVQIVSSSDPKLVVGKIQHASVSDTQKALTILEQALLENKWCQENQSAWVLRLNSLTKAAHLMLARRNELAALIVYEAGKTVSEALGDVDEAIDFIHFYMREEARLHRHADGLAPRGPIAVISPWNFPLAIPCGMVCASLVAGNPVALKSAEQTPLIASAMVELFHQAGVPESVLIHLPGEGESVGDALVKSAAIAGIVFTGSKNVGVHIAKNAQTRLYHNKKTNTSYPVRVVTEMGGKNAIIVTSSAELDETVSGILASAFGHSGQKCSAASRVIVDTAVMDRLKERLKEALKDLQVGAAYDFSTDVNPLITSFDQDRVRQIAKEATQEINEYGSEVILDRTGEAYESYCVGPALFEVPYKRAFHPESWAQKEIFGPVVHLIRVQNLNEAVEVYNSTEYALTGGVFSQSQDEIDWLTGQMENGNIYINRTITGARVGIEPFGGFKLSGTGPKAGGKSYITSFHLNIESDLEKEIYTDANDKQLPQVLGSDYQFDLARPSGLGAWARATRMIQTLESLHSQYEVYFRGVDGDQKETLSRFKKWVGQNFVHFQNKEHQNHKIPGQLSYNDFSMKQEHAVVIVSHPRAPFKTLMQTLAAVTVGTGVTIIARNQAAYLWWNQLVELFYRSGFSKDNIGIYFSSHEGLLKALEEDKISTIIVDDLWEINDEKLEGLYPQGKAIKRMRSLLTPYDGAHKNDFKRLCEHYIWVRSFAVNTMRHGAPLDTELS